MSKTDIGLIVTDLDGTFLMEHAKLSEENVRAFHRAHQLGIPVAIASGRLAGVVSRIARDMALDDCHIIGLNGGHVLDSAFGQTLSMHVFPDALVLQMKRILDDTGCEFNIYTDEGVYTNEAMDDERRERFASNFAGSGCTVYVAPDAARRLKGKRVLKYLVKKKQRAAAYDAAKRLILSLPEVYLTTSGLNNFEVMLRNVGKAQAVAALSNRLGVPLANVMAFGDFDNDREMLSACGLSVAMGNATEEVKQSARFITLTNQESGVAHAIHAALDQQWECIEKL